MWGRCSSSKNSILRCFLLPLLMMMAIVIDDELSNDIISEGCTPDAASLQLHTNSIPGNFSKPTSTQVTFPL